MKIPITVMNDDKTNKMLDDTESEIFKFSRDIEIQ